jgi:transposase InsO family protein
VCLLVVRRTFGDRIPTLSDYTKTHDVSIDTLRRLAQWLCPFVLSRLESRRPGPRSSVDSQEAAAPPLPFLLAANSLLKALLPGPLTKVLNASAHLRGVVVEQVLHFSKRGVSREQMASLLGLSVRTLRRWIRGFFDEGNGQQVPHKSRRPHRSPAQLPAEIQEALWKLRIAFPDLSTAELTRLFNERARDLLREHEIDAISAKTAGRYLNGHRPAKPLPSPKPPASPRGGYVYPGPLAMAWMDTTYFTVAGVTIHIAAAMEARCRIALAAEAFVQECADTTIEILGCALARVPELSAVVRDRGTPYLNARVTELITSRGVLPINAHPYFPIDKAGLERWWGTLKAWLHHALEPFEAECGRRGITPSREQVVETVRPALRVSLRAYNLLPQRHLDGESPIERIDALLRGEGDPGFTLSSLRRTAMERESKDDLLQEVKDALQISIPIERLRRDVVGISKDALRYALGACHQRIVIERDPEIRSPLRYLLAVARTAERRHQDEVERRQRDSERRRSQDQEKEATARALGQEEEQRVLRPEEVLPQELERWITGSQNPITAIRRIADTRLARILDALRHKYGAAATAMIVTARTRIPSLSSRIAEPTADATRILLGRLDALVAGTPPERAPPPRPPPTSGRQTGDSKPPWSPLKNLVRKTLAALQAPHVYRPDVSS